MEEASALANNVAILAKRLLGEALLSVVAIPSRFT